MADDAGNTQRNAEGAGDTVAQFWDRTHKDAAGGAHDNYLNHPLIQAYISLRAFGALVSHIDAAIEAVRTHTDPGDRVLSLGCGPGHKERLLAAALPDREFIGIDIAGEIVAAANAELRQLGFDNLSLMCGDFNQLELEPASLKIVLGLGAIHHVENLEGLWKASRVALVPGGVVLAQEFVGPNRFQWTDAQIAAGDDVLGRLLPDEHKVHHTRVERPDLAEMITLDPSEAVRSAEIVPTCRAAGFTIEALTSAGGALLQPVLMYQVHTFDPQNWDHNHVLSQLFQEEDRLMREAVLQDDFVMLVARP